MADDTPTAEQLARAYRYLKGRMNISEGPQTTRYRDSQLESEYNRSRSATGMPEPQPSPAPPTYNATESYNAFHGGSPSLDSLTGTPRPITAMSDEAEQMTHRPEMTHPDQAIAQSLLNVFGGAISEVAGLPKRIIQSSETMRKGGEYDPAPAVEAATATPFGRAMSEAMAVKGMFGSMMPGEAKAESRKARSEREAAQKADQTRLEQEGRLKEISARSAAAREEAEKQAALAKEAEERHAQAAAEEEQHKLDMSFREKHPQLSNFFTGMGWATSFALPYVSRMLNTRATNALVKEVQTLATDANKAIADGEVRKATTLINQLAAKEKQARKMDKDGKLSKMLVGTSAMAPIELGAAPEELDLMFGTPKAKERAKEELNPLTNPARLPFALAQGVSLSSIGAKGPTQRRLPVPEGQASAARKSLKEVKTDITKARAAEKPKSEESPKKRKLYGVGSKAQGQFGE